MAFMDEDCYIIEPKIEIIDLTGDEEERNQMHVFQTQPAPSTISQARPAPIPNLLPNCPICLNVVQIPVTSHCGHIFCEYHQDPIKKYRNMFLIHMTF